jgi:integrase
MPQLKLTKGSVEGLKAPDSSGKQTFYWDKDLPSFGVLVSGTTKVKTYVVQHRIANLGGKYRRVAVGRVDALSLDEAREEAKNKLAEMFAGKDPKRPRRAPTGTLRAALDTYLAANKKLRPKSRAGYRKDVERHLNDWLDKPLREITADRVEDRHAQIKGAVERRAKGRKLVNGAATANGVFRVLRALWNFAADRDDTLGRNPVGRLKDQWYLVPKREGLVKGDQLADFYRAIDALPNGITRDYLMLLLFTGMRRGEAAALRWDDVDFGLRVIRLPAKRTKAGRKLDLPMTDFVRGLLAARRSIGRDASGFVFPANSRSGHIEEPRFALRLVKEATNITVTPHDLRRTYVTVAENTDISPLALKALVNHSLGDDVTSGYVQMTVERLREPAQRVADKFKELCAIVGAPTGASEAPRPPDVPEKRRNRPSRLRAALRGPRCGLGRSARYGVRGASLTAQD